MLEVRITAAPDLVQAINNLAAAIAGVKPLVSAAANPTQAPSETVPPMGAPAAPVTTVQPTAAPAPDAPVTAPSAYPSSFPAPQSCAAPANPTPAAPSAATAQTGAPAAPSVGPASAYPSNWPTPVAYPGQPPMPQQPAQPTGVPVTAPPQYTIDQIMKAGGTLMDAGRTDDLTNLLHSFGVRAVTELKPEQTGAFATALRGLGAQI